MSLRPIPFKIFKGITGKWGALNLSLSLPLFVKGQEKSYDGLDKDGKFILDGRDGWKVREGCVFLEMASTIAPNVYDWDNKIVFALSVQDLSQFLLSLRTGDEMQLMHDPGAKSDSQGEIKKYLSFTSPKGLKTGGMLSLSQTVGEDTRRHTVPLSGVDVITIGELLRVALVKCLNW
jgi:hypothetical protein